MAVNSVSGVGANVNSAAAANAKANDPESQRNLFMSLLVAQLKNQDPLQPQDGTAFVAQLAQFNSLDQLVGIRQSIETLATSINTKAPAATAPTTAPATTPTTTPTATNPNPSTTADLS